ncbi:hypothetical protein BT67DRAFT_62627 [Trichocladium antarcticum]|uniref:Uncharacterized protein n=1 Tax=Trichocladium antarcticum TaxID=1450529 RepID=A0AAN6ZC52_9PEZI|nr:hypothetical protein BT67DRAFT_62627 [Trichocladium antarcticum]
MLCITQRTPLLQRPPPHGPGPLQLLWNRLPRKRPGPRTTWKVLKKSKEKTVALFAHLSYHSKPANQLHSPVVQIPVEWASPGRPTFRDSFNATTSLGSPGAPGFPVFSWQNPTWPSCLPCIWNPRPLPIKTTTDRLFLSFLSSVYSLAFLSRVCRRTSCLRQSVLIRAASK